MAAEVERGGGSAEMTAEEDEAVLVEEEAWRPKTNIGGGGPNSARKTLINSLQPAARGELGKNHESGIPRLAARKGHATWVRGRKGQRSAILSARKKMRPLMKWVMELERKADPQQNVERRIARLRQWR
jgi:hypothetical protein